MLEFVSQSDLNLTSDLAAILTRIRQSQDRIAAESWDQFLDRTYSLALAELNRRKRKASPTIPHIRKNPHEQT